MDTRTGRLYGSKEEALAAGVPEDVLAVVDDPQEPEQTEGETYTIQNGPFKGRRYRRNARGQSVRVK